MMTYDESNINLISKHVHRISDTVEYYYIEETLINIFNAYFQHHILQRFKV